MRRTFILLTLWFSVAAAGANATDWQAFMLESATVNSAYAAGQVGEIGVPVSHPDGWKSPKTGLLLSALLPGAGQYYGGSLLKAVGFVAVEALSWTMYAVYNAEGNDIDAEFRDYADAHWIESDYWDWIANHSGRDRNDLPALREWEHENFSHGLHEQKDQQYYEMIGKYDQFNSGWDDSEIGLLDDGWDKSLRSARRLYYEGRRDASNRAFKKATTGITIVLLNHIVSSLDAAWTISRHNRSLAQASLQFEPVKFNQQPATALTLRLNW